MAVDDSDTRNPVNSAARQLDAKRQQHQHRQNAGQQDLQSAAAEDQRGDASQLFEAELDADGEEEQDDAKLRRRVHQRGVGDDAERAWPNHDPREQEADDRDQSDAIADVRDGRGSHDQRDGLDQKRRRDGRGNQHVKRRPEARTFRT